MDLEVTNPNLFEKTVASIALDKIGPMTITRLLRRGAAEPTRVSGDTVLKKGDHLRELYTASVISILATLRQFGLPLLAAGILTTAYATVYPVALIGMILFTKLLIWIL